MRLHRGLKDAYNFPGFRPTSTVRGVFSDPKARVLRSAAGEKTNCGVCRRIHRTFYDHKLRRVRDLSCGDFRIYLEIESRRVLCQSCGQVKLEELSWWSDHPSYSKRFAFFVGRRCRAATIQDVAKELPLDWRTVQELEKQYLREQLRRMGTPGPKVIGIDEVSIRKGHTYRIVVSRPKTCAKRST